MVDSAEAEKDSAKVLGVMRFKVETGCTELASHLVDVDATLEGLFSVLVFEDRSHKVSVVHEESSELGSALAIVGEEALKHLLDWLKVEVGWLFLFLFLGSLCLL